MCSTNKINSNPAINTVEITVKNTSPVAKEIVDQSILDKEKKENKRNLYLINTYGITIEDYSLLYNKQEGCCKLCGNKEEKLVVDHDHLTNMVRGLLCHNCNIGLGHFKDNDAVLSKAITYLESSRKYTVNGIDIYFPQYKDKLKKQRKEKKKQTT